MAQLQQLPNKCFRYFKKLKIKVVVNGAGVSAQACANSYLKAQGSKE